MPINRMTAFTIAVILLCAPYALWMLLYVIERRSDVNLRPVLPWIRALRWVAYVATLALFATHFAYERFPSVFAFSSLGFSSGLFLMENWAARRFAPDLRPSTGDGWWPSKPQ